MITKVRDFIQGNAIMFAEYLNNKFVPQHIKEQALYRAFLCSDCLLQGHCKVCGCKTPNMFYSPNKQDSERKWGEMLEEQEWNKFKERNGLSSFDFSFQDILDGKARPNIQLEFQGSLLGSESTHDTSQGVQGTVQEGQEQEQARKQQTNVGDSSSVSPEK